MEACEAACSREAAAAALVMALTDRVRKGQLELDDLREESAEDKDEIRRLKDQVRACAASFRHGILTDCRLESEDGTRPDAPQRQGAEWCKTILPPV